MSGLYESLKGRVHDTLQREKSPLVRVKRSTALSLNGEMDELERIVVSKLSKIKAAVKEGEALVSDEARQANELTDSFKVRIAVLDAKLNETEEAIRKKELSWQQIEESLTARNQNLQNDIKKKDEVLATQCKEIDDLKLNLEDKLKQIGELHSGIKVAKQEAADAIRRAQEVADSCKAELAALESRLKEAEELARQKDLTIQGMAQKLTAKTQENEILVRDKEKIVAWREAEVADLKAQLQVLKKGIGEMSSFFRRAEVFSGIKGQDGAAATQNEPANGREENRVKGRPDAGEVKPMEAAAAAEMVPPDLFQRITGELAEVTGVISPLASVIVHQQVAALGESLERFPKARLTELLENLAQEISDKSQQILFRGRLARNAHVDLN